MKEINLREYYPFYNMDVYLEVTDEIAGQLDRFKLDEESHRVRILRAKAYFSLDRGDGIEKAFYLDGESKAKIAERENVNESAVRKSIRTGLTALKKFLNAE